jgi:hypothetical protein
VQFTVLHKKLAIGKSLSRSFEPLHVVGHRQQAFLFQQFYSHLWAHNLPDVQEVVFWLPDIAKKMYCNLYH